MKKKYIIGIVFVIVVIFVAVISHRISEKEVTIFAMDTVMTIKIKGDEKNLEEAERLIKDIDSKFNAYNENSYIYKLNSGEITSVPDDVYFVIEKALNLCYETDGNFNIAVKDLKDLWNIGSLAPVVPDDESVKEAVEKCDYTKIKLEDNNVYLNGVHIDLGGIVKGYATDELVKMFKNNGVKEAVIDLGGNIYVYGDGNSKIGIQKPFSARGDIVCVTTVSDRAVISSGSYERYFESENKVYHHIFDTKTGYPADNLVVSVTVTGIDAATCDAYSTALMVMGEEKAIEFYKKQGNFEFALIKNNKILHSNGFKIEQADEGYATEIIK